MLVAVRAAVLMVAICSGRRLLPPKPVYYADVTMGMEQVGMVKWGV